MSINKFGSSSGSTTTVAARGERGIGFALTPDNDYDIRGHRLTNLKDGEDNSDATTVSQVESIKVKSENLSQELTTLKRKIESDALLADHEAGNFLAKKLRIRDVGFPRIDTDATTKVYVDRNFSGISEDKTFYKALQKPIRDVGEPTLPSDAATKQFVESRAGMSLVTFYASTPIGINYLWGVGLNTHSHIITHKAMILKVALYSSNKDVVMVANCSYGTESFEVSKRAGEQSTLTNFLKPKIIPKDSVIAVSSNVINNEENTSFKLDLYMLYVY